jgi:hypothetical protein
MMLAALMPAIKKSICIFFLLTISLNAISQTGIYRKTDKTGASCTISIVQEGKKIHTDIFAWWHTASGTHGTFSGDGVIQNNKAALKGTDDGTRCSINLSFNKKFLTVVFADCMTYNLPEDFSGNFTKITDKIPGDYTIITDKAYFYKAPKESTRLKAYLVRGNNVQIDLENVIDENWVFVNFTNASGKITSAYMQWNVMKK